MRYTRMLTSLVVATLGLSTFVTSAQGAIPSVPPEILAQLKSMSPSEQRALARQYGFNLDQVLGVAGGDGDIGERPALGAPGEPLEQVKLDEDTREESFSEDTEEELQRFGSNLFDSEVSTFAPVDNIPVPEGYRLGVGDELRVMLIGKEQGDFTLLIDRDGSVTLPKLGRVVLSGLTFPEAKTLIEKRVSEQLIGSEAILSMGSLRTINVFIAGEVKKPGNYSVSALSTLSQAVYVAGGISDAGSFRAIQLKRRGETVGSFDIYDLLLYGDNSGDVRLQNGDVVFVPFAGPQAIVSGAVVRPAIYELKAGNTIRDLLNMAGGMLATANPQQALLKRYPPGASLPSLDNLSLLEPGSLDAPVIDGDALSVPGMSTRVANPLVIEGSTGLAGLIAWTDGLKVADVFKDLEADVEPTADLNLSLIVRRKNSLNDIVVFPFSLTKALISPSSKDNITLQPFDRVVILPQATLLGSESRQDLIESIVARLEQQTRSGERAQVVTVAGAVRDPGAYPLVGDGSVADVVALAGGYPDSAYLERVEVRRILLSQAQQAEVEILNISLANEFDSSFKLVGRDTVRINTIPNWTTEDTIELSGEFVFPGIYTIYEGENISSLIERAGGFTNQAFLNGAQFFSSSARASQARQLKKITASMERGLASRRAVGESPDSNSKENTVNLIDEEQLGRVVIDLRGIVDGREASDIVVESGDRLFVPKFSNTIAVVGEVYEPGTFRFEEGISLESYIKMAGGATNYALTKNTYLLKADGSVSYKKRGLEGVIDFRLGTAEEIGAGDVVVVPTNLDYEPPLARISAITGVVFQSLTSIAAFLSIGSN